MSRARELLLLELGCEEIPARMIPRAAADLEHGVVGILDEAGLAHGDAIAWGGSRRLAVRVAAVEDGRPDRDETVLGPPVAAAWPEGAPTRAAVGFAAKHGVAPQALVEIETERGRYAGFHRRVPGRTLGAILAEALPGVVAAMSFPKTMRWGDGAQRWVRPLHWLVALHGATVLPLRLFGVEAGRRTMGHRFLSGEPPTLAHADDYESALERAHVVCDPAKRRARLAAGLSEAARRIEGQPVEDPELLAEAADLVEWPGVVAGSIDERHLELPREILVTTLRHHQKCFSVQDDAGRLRPGFLAVANTDRDPGGHVRRGNEWVVGGRLDDARFFWSEDRKRPLADRVADLERVTFHVKVGSYADKAASTARLAARLAAHVGLGEEETRHAAEAARLAKADLVTGLVGEFPELQGVVGGLLLRADAAPAAVAAAVYDHYRPSGADDALPATETGCVVAVADKLDTVAALLGAGELPTGSRDPFGLRRALNGALRIAVERRWPLAPADLVALSDRTGDPAVRAVVSTFVRERLENSLQESGFTANEVRAVLRAGRGSAAAGWPLHETVARLRAIAAIRGRADFEHLVDLTRRVANIRRKAEQDPAVRPSGGAAFRESEPAALELERLIGTTAARIEALARERRFEAIVEELAALIRPVDSFFETCLVIDTGAPEATASRLGLLGTLEGVLTQHFDLRELPGQAERRT